MKTCTPRILIVTRNFPPLKGGMERLLHHVYAELHGSYRMAIVGPAGCNEYINPDTAFASAPPLPPARFLLRCHWETLRMVRSFRPHLILAGSGFTAPSARTAGTFHGIPVACYAHGLDLVFGHPLYQRGFVPAIKNCETVIVNSSNTADLAIQKGVSRAKIRVLHPGVSIPESMKDIDGSTFRHRIGAGSRPLLLSVGRLTERKGIAEFVENCLPGIKSRIPEILYVIIGDEPRQALNGHTGMVQRITRIAHAKGLEEHVLIIRDADDQTLWQAYASSQLFVFPVKEVAGDIEGFGMVAVEAASHGLPTAAFAVGGVVDAVADSVSGYLVEPGNYPGLMRVVIEHLRAPPAGVTAQTCIDFARIFSWNRFGSRLRGICAELLAA